MKFALRTVAKCISALSGSLEELRYEAGEYKDMISKANKLLLEARSLLVEIIEAM